MNIPPPPPGFEIIPDTNVPPPPPGFVLVGTDGSSIDTPSADVNIDTDPESWGEFAAGTALKAGQGLTFNYADELLASIASGAGYDREDTLNAIRESEKTFEKRHPYVSVAAELSGALGSGVGAGIGMMRAIPALERLALRGIGGTTASSAAMGAPMASLAATGDTEGDESIAEAALYGGLTGGAFGAGTGAFGRSVSGLAGPWIDDAAARLRQAGVRLTPGEMLGGNWKRTEDTAASAPFLGHLIRRQQRQSVDSLNRAAVNRALSPDAALSRRMTAANPDVGHDMIGEATRQLKRRYDEIVPRMSARNDGQLAVDLHGIGVRLPRAVQNEFQDSWHRQIFRVTDPAGNIDGRGLQQALGGLRTEGRNLMTSPGSQAYDRDLGRALLDARDALIAAARRQTHPRTMGDFDRIQEAYAGFARIRDAASRTGADQGVFSPSHLAAAVRSGDRSAGRGDFARGQALMQDLSGPAKSVMTRSVADSGTPERAALMGAILAPQTALTGLAAGAPAMFFYTNVGRRLFERLAAGSPQTRTRLRRLLEISTRAGAPAAALASQ